jgi:hypothetical protein
VLAASYGADTQGLPGIEPWDPDMQQLLFASLLSLRLVSRLLARHKKQDTAARTSRFARARSTPLQQLQDSSLIDDTTSSMSQALTVTLRHVAKLATDYQAAPPVLLLLLDLSCLITLCGAAVFLVSAHASVLPLSHLCDASITLGSPPCTPYATKEAARLAEEIVWSFPLSCLTPQASVDTTQGSSTCAEDSSCTCGCLEKGYVYGCYRCCPNSCVKKKIAKVTYEKSGGLGWQCAAVKEEAKANTLEFPNVYQGEHRLLWPIPFNSLQGANGRGFHSWYAQGPLPLIRRRLMWRGIATVLLMLAMSARFFLLSVAALGICSVWVSPEALDALSVMLFVCFRSLMSHAPVSDDDIAAHEELRELHSTPMLPLEPRRAADSQRADFVTGARMLSVSGRFEVIWDFVRRPEAPLKQDLAVSIYYRGPSVPFVRAVPLVAPPA